MNLRTLLAFVVALAQAVSPCAAALTAPRIIPGRAPIGAPRLARPSLARPAALGALRRPGALPVRRLPAPDAANLPDPSQPAVGLTDGQPGLAGPAAEPSVLEMAHNLAEMDAQEAARRGTLGGAYDGSLARPKTAEVRMEEYLPDGQQLAIRVMGDEDSEPINAIEETDVDVDKTYDVVVVGAGLAGLSAAWHLKDKDILVLDRAHHLGGLAAFGETSKTGITYGRGAAYITEPEGEVAKIYKDIGMTDINSVKIHEPIDSLFNNGGLIEGMWEHDKFFEDVQDPGFLAFRDALRSKEIQDCTDFNPPEPIPAGCVKYDQMTAEHWVRKFDSPKLANLLDSYTQSALGGHLNQISALGFLLFYTDEIEPRYTWAGGTGGASSIMAKKLIEHNKKMFRTRAHVSDVVNTKEGAEVIFERDGKQYRVKAKKVISAATLNVSRKIVKDMPVFMQNFIDGIQYAHYIIHNVFTEKDYYTKTYDTWFPGYGAYPFTDVITGRWMETHGFKVRPKGKGILTVYQPLAPPNPTDILSPKSVAELAKRAAVGLRALVPEIAKEKKLEIESFRWPNSIHLVVPGFLSFASSLTAPIGNIFLANNNQGTPSFETALLEGKRAADEVRAAIEKEDARSVNP